MEETCRSQIFDALGDLRLGLCAAALDERSLAEALQLAARIEDEILDDRPDSQAAKLAVILHGLLVNQGSDAGRPLAQLLYRTRHLVQPVPVGRRADDISYVDSPARRGNVQAELRRLR